MKSRTTKWESESKIKLVLSVLNHISEFCKQYEIDIVGNKIQVTELPDGITLEDEAIFGKNQWIVSGDKARFARLLGEYTQIWKEVGVGDLDSRIIYKIKSKQDIYETINILQRSNSSNSCMLKFWSDYSMQRHDCLKVLEFAFLEQIYILKSDLDTKNVNQVFEQINPLLKKMRSLKKIAFQYHNEMHEAIKQLDLKGLQQNGVKICFNSCPISIIKKYLFVITAGECIVLHAQNEIKAFNIKAKGDIIIEVISWDFNYTINNEYLLWDLYRLIKFEIDWELTDNTQEISFPKFENKLNCFNHGYLILIPLNKIKQVSYKVFLGSNHFENDWIKNQTKEFDNKVCKPLTKPSSLFCLLNEDTKINI